jgi:DNA replication and repair protein RecF
MYLSRLSLTNFRSITRQELDIPRRIILLFGANAQGKTSILEAIYYLATFTSFNASTDRQLINFNEPEIAQKVARIEADYIRGGRKHTLAVALIQETNGAGIPPRFRKEIKLDGVKKTATEVIGHFNAVIFLPHMSRIIEGGPEERRRYLNLALSQVVTGYAQSLNEYSQALAQRNALLKLLGEKGGNADQLDFWDELVAKLGAQIMQARITAIQEIERFASRLHSRLSNTSERLRLVYQPAYEPAPAVNGRSTGQFSLPIASTLTVDRSAISLIQLKEGFCRRLRDIRSEEIARGMTTIGPHRDEVRFLSNMIDMGDFGSRGQVRTALLALKLAEMAWMKDRTGHTPVLLLDETLAELDIQRRADLLAALDDCEQALLTTTDLNLFTTEFLNRAVHWQVNAGQITYQNH